MAHYGNVVHHHKGFVAAKMPNAIMNCLKPMLTLITRMSSAGIAIITRPQNK